MAVVNCEDLGIGECNFVASAEVPGEAAEQMINHLREEHGLNGMPDVDVAMQGAPPLNASEDVRLVVERLQNALNVSTYQPIT